MSSDMNDDLIAPAILDANDNAQEFDGLRNIAERQLNPEEVKQFVFQKVAAYNDKRTSAQTEFLADLYLSGKSTSAFAKSRHLTEGAVRMMLTKFDLPTVREFATAFEAWRKLQ